MTDAVWARSMHAIALTVRLANAATTTGYSVVMPISTSPACYRRDRLVADGVRTHRHVEAVLREEAPLVGDEDARRRLAGLDPDPQWRERVRRRRRGPGVAPRPPARSRRVIAMTATYDFMAASRTVLDRHDSVASTN